MFGFLRNLGGPVRYEQPRREPSRLDLDDAEREAEIEAEIEDIDSAIREEAARGDMVAVDLLLERRNRVREPRPAQVPGIPGRSS